MMRFASLFALMVAFLLSGPPAHSAVQSYDQESAGAAGFNGNAIDIDVRNFEGLVNPNDSFLQIDPQPLVLAPTVAFPATPPVSIISNGTLIVYPSGLSNSFQAAHLLSRNFGNLNELSVMLTGTGATALGFVYGTSESAFVGMTFTASVIGSAGLSSPLAQFSLNLPAAENTPKFVGFTSDSQITGVVFSATDVSHFNLLQVSVGTAALVPEPSQYFLFGVGLALLAAVGRRKAA